MIFLLGVVFVIVLSVWLWGEDSVKTAIKWLLGLSIFIIFLVFVINYIDKKANQDKEAELQKSYESGAVAPNGDETFSITPDEHSQQKLQHGENHSEIDKKTMACYEKYEKSQEEAKSKLPECARYIVRYQDEKENNCRINWGLQNDEGLIETIGGTKKDKDQYDSDKKYEETFDQLIQCAKN